MPSRDSYRCVSRRFSTVVGTRALLGIALLWSPATLPRPLAAVEGESRESSLHVSAFGQQMENGPAVCHSLTFVEPNINARTWSGALTRALVIALPGDTSLAYDMNHLSLAAIWQGGFLDTSLTHLTSYKGQQPPRPAAEPSYVMLDQVGCLVNGKPLSDPLTAFTGHYLHGDKVVLSYRAGDRKVLEVPWIDTVSSATADSPLWLSRTFAVSPGADNVSIVVGNVASAHRGSEGVAPVVAASASLLDMRLVPEVATVSLRSTTYGSVVLFPSSDTWQRATVWFRTPDKSGANRVASEPPATSLDPRQLTNGGPVRWPNVSVTQGQLGEESAAYVVDELTLPDSPYGSWMRPSSLAFFDSGASAEDSRLAVATLSGDVWIVSWDNPSLNGLHWKRFATGLYEPLGMLVIDGSVYVRGRDRITILRDLNEDGEADFYENFHSQGEIGPGYHGFIFDLVRDEREYLYYVISGRKAPSVGEVVRLSPDGRHGETIATNFRHPNGMGAGGPYGWITIAENDQDKFPAGGMIVQRGGRYAWESDRTVPYVYLLPPSVDSSPGSQIWTDRERWGPLGGTLVHTSYSKSTLSYVLIQDNDYRTDLETGSQSGELPNGFAAKLPFQFRSGIMRGAIHPVDGQLYVAGLRGWDTNAATDGCLSRVRYTGRPAYLVSSAAVQHNGIRLEFSCELDQETVDYDNFFAERIGDDQIEVDIDDVIALDERTVLVELSADALLAGGVVDRRRTQDDASGKTHYRVIDPLAIEFQLRASDGTPLKDTIYCTVNSLPTLE